MWAGADQTQLVGVASIDLNIAALRDTLNQTDLYERGYVLVWDDNGMTVIHKSLKSGLPRYDIAWVDATAGGKYEEDEDWTTAQALGMFDKGRVAGNFNFTFKGEVWYYTFMPIPDTPYMISLSVVYPEVTKTADDMLSRLSFGVQFAVSFSFGKLACALDLARMPREESGVSPAAGGDFFGSFFQASLDQSATHNSGVANWRNSLLFLPSTRLVRQLVQRTGLTRHPCDCLRTCALTVAFKPFARLTSLFMCDNRWEDP